MRTTYFVAGSGLFDVEHSCDSSCSWTEYRQSFSARLSIPPHVHVRGQGTNGDEKATVDVLQAMPCLFMQPCVGVQ